MNAMLLIEDAQQPQPRFILSPL